MSRKRQRSSHSDGLACPELQDQDGNQLASSTLQNLVVSEFLSALEQEWPEDRKSWVACPFPRKNPERYARVTDNACLGWGFRSIGDLRDHIKRSHSSKYGCHGCKARFSASRETSLAKAEEKHRKECRWHPPLTCFPVSEFDPEVMDPEQDEALQIDFRKKEFKHVKEIEDQYWFVCTKLWPALQPFSFNMWSKPGTTVTVDHVIQLLRNLPCLQSSMGGPEVDEETARDRAASPDLQIAICTSHEYQGASVDPACLGKWPQTTGPLSAAQELFELERIAQPPKAVVAKQNRTSSDLDSGIDLKGSSEQQDGEASTELTAPFGSSWSPDSLLYKAGGSFSQQDLPEEILDHSWAINLDNEDGFTFDRQGND